VSHAHYGRYTLKSHDGRHEITVAPSSLPPLRLYLHGQRPAFTLESTAWRILFYRIEESPRL